MQCKGKLLVVARNKRGFKVEGNDNWFNATEAVVPYLEKIPVNTEVIVTYNKKGIRQEAIKIVPVKKEVPARKVANKSEKRDLSKIKTEDETEKIATSRPTGYYGSPEDIAGKEVGCAANAAAAILSGRQEDPETLLEMFRILCNGILEHIRTLK